MSKDIRAMSVIRVLVKSGGGVGHQRAAITLMERLRELGFTGEFDIWWSCGEGSVGIKGDESVGQKLADMIPQIALERNGSFSGCVPTLGKIRLSPLPDAPREPIEFSRVELAVCAADDAVGLLMRKNQAERFNATACLSLEPTDWDKGACYTAKRGEVSKFLPPASVMRLSSSAFARVPYKRDSLESIEKALADLKNIASHTRRDRIRLLLRKSYCSFENRVFDLIGRFHSQLVYGLMPERVLDRGSGIGEINECGEYETICGYTPTGYVGEVNAMKTLLGVHLELHERTQKPVVLFMPQAIFSTIQSTLSSEFDSNRVLYVDLTRRADLNLEEFQKAQVIVAYTEKLPYRLFEHLLGATSYPPVIEGCNALEYCDSKGLPFVALHRQTESIKPYDVRLSEVQETHRLACQCMVTGEEGQRPLLDYLYECMRGSSKHKQYHQQRQRAWQERPDACVTALDQLNIIYHRELAGDFTSVNFFSEVKRQPAVCPEPPRVYLP